MELEREKARAYFALKKLSEGFVEAFKSERFIDAEDYWLEMEHHLIFLVAREREDMTCKAIKP